MTTDDNRSMLIMTNEVRAYLASLPEDEREPYLRKLDADVSAWLDKQPPLNEQQREFIREKFNLGRHQPRNTG